MGNKPGSNYYCTHCKVHDHSIDRCFKIHGYPPNFNKDKKIDAAAVTPHKSEEHSVTEDHSQDLVNISLHQYKQLMKILNKQNINETKPDGNVQGATGCSDHTALLSGKACLLSCFTSGWI